MTRDMGIDLVRKPAGNDDAYVIELFGQCIDTSLSYRDPRYKGVVKKLKANVLILGLGFGFAVLEACKKKYVKTVTVVENNPEIVALFYMMNGKRFPGYQKLEIILADAIKIDLSDRNLDHVFIDLFDISTDYHRSQMEILFDRYKGIEIHRIKKR